MENCNVCFETIDIDECIHCYDEKCNSIICKDCMIQYINVTEDLPKCVRRDCDNKYLLSNILRLPTEKVDKYNLLCLNYFLNSNSDEIKNQIVQNDLIQKIRDEKIKFIQTFPKSLQKVINLCMKDKLKKISKNNLNIVDKIVNSKGRFCMLSYCNGKLNKDLKCIKCATEFCLNCEKIKRNSHECKDNDIKNIEYLKNISECPNCKIPIEKSEGCRSMRCTNCHTFFDYYTKEKTDHGGINTDIVVKERNKLSIEYKNIYDQNILKLLTIFENKLLNIDIEKHKGRILKIITEYIENNKNDTKKYAEKISKTYSRNTLSEHNYRVSMKKISEIEDLHEHNELTYCSLKNILGS